jgi:hypothetical protein
VGPTNACRFLGFTFHGTRIHWSPEALQDFRHRLRQLTGRSCQVLAQTAHHYVIPQERRKAALEQACQGRQRVNPHPD